MSARLSVSSWTLHPVLGSPLFWGVGTEPAGAPPSGLPLQELPAQIAGTGINTFELTHFHLPTLDTLYLAQLRENIEDAGLELWSFLVDDGDITGPEAARDEEWIADFFPVARQLGAKCVRVIAGKAAPTGPALAQSRAALGRLAAQAATHQLRLLTENWFDLLSTPRAVHSLLDGIDVGLNFDFGNWTGPQKYYDLAQIVGIAEGSHAKAHFENDEIDEGDFERCLQLLRDAGFDGPLTLVCDNATDRWRAVAQAKAIAERYLERGI